MSKYDYCKWNVVYGDSELFNHAEKSAFVAARFGGNVFSFDSIEELCSHCAGENKTPFRVSVRKMVINNER